MKKAKQNIMNTSAQVARSEIVLGLPNTVGAAQGAAGPTTADGREADQQTGSPSSGESGDQEEGASEGVSVFQESTPIIVALAISINFAADFQKGNENVVETDQASA